MKEIEEERRRLRGHRENLVAQLAAVDVALQELDDLQRRITVLGKDGSVLTAAREANGDWSHMRLTDAARKFVAEQGGSASTREIVKALKEHGVPSLAARPSANVYATLTSAKDFRRNPKKKVWELVTKPARGVAKTP